MLGFVRRSACTKVYLVVHHRAGEQLADPDAALSARMHFPAALSKESREDGMRLRTRTIGRGLLALVAAAVLLLGSSGLGAAQKERLPKADTLVSARQSRQLFSKTV